MKVESPFFSFFLFLLSVVPSGFHTHDIESQVKIVNCKELISGQTKQLKIPCFAYCLTTGRVPPLICGFPPPPQPVSDAGALPHLFSY